jgi:hypothetical protein
LKRTVARRLLACVFAPCLAAASVLAACTLTTSLEGLSSGGAVVDGGGPGPGEAATGAESGSGDTGVDAPMPIDSGTTDGGPSVPFCQTVVPAPAFCDDFERSDLKGTWDTEVLGAGGVLAIEPSTRTAQGHELHATIPFFTGGGISQAHLSRNLSVASAVTLSYALRIDSAPPQGAQQAMNVRIVVEGDFASTYLLIHPDAVSFVEQTFPQDASTMSVFIEHPLAHPVLFGTWQRITVTTTLGASPRHTVSIDGVVAYDAPADPFFRTGLPEIVAGIDYSVAPTGPLSVRVDDLYVQRQ